MESQRYRWNRSLSGVQWVPRFYESRRTLRYQFERSPDIPKEVNLYGTMRVLQKRDSTV
jgi:hypothetical protein